MAKKTKRAKLVEEYAIKVQTLETEKEKQELLDKLNADLEAIGEPKMLNLTEVERKAKAEKEQAEGFTVVDPDTIPDIPDHFPTYDPDHKGQTVRCKDKRGVWDVHYNERGYQDGVARVTF